MIQANLAFSKRTLAIGSGIVVLLLAGLAFYFRYATDTAEYLGDVVVVAAKPVKVPAGFEQAFKEFTGLLLVDGEGQVMAITPKGARIDLCGPGQGPDCKVALTAYALVDALSNPRE